MPEENTPKNPAEHDSFAKALRRTARPAHFASLARRAAACLRERGAEALWREASFRISLMTKGEVWRFRADIPLRRELKAQRAARFARMPLVSVVVPLYNTPPKFLREMMRSVLGQTYAGLELVLADASDAAHGEVEKAVRAVRDARVRYIRLAKNGGIAENTNAALAAAQGEYIALLDHDDVLTPNALYEAVKAVNEQGADFVYSDEIVLDSTLKKLGEYHFKPDFSPDTLRGCNYITHLAVFSRALLAAAGGGERAEFDGAQDFRPDPALDGARPKGGARSQSAVLVARARRLHRQRHAGKALCAGGGRGGGGGPASAPGHARPRGTHSRQPRRIPHPV